MTTSQFVQEPISDHDLDWVGARVDHLAGVDQLVRMRRRPVELAEMPDEQQRFSELLRPVWEEVDERHIQELKELVERHGWIDIHRFGADTSKRAWLIAQHAPKHPEFQRRVHSEMGALVPGGGADGQHWAMLGDRIAVFADEPQVYGTQGRCGDDGWWAPYELVDEAGLSERRADVGLPPMDEYRSWFDCAGTLGRAAHAKQAGDHLQCHTLLAEFAQDRGGMAAAEAWYNAASCAALDGDSQTALSHLGAALEHGYSDVEHLQQDGDLRSLHDDPGWKVLVGEVVGHVD